MATGLVDTDGHLQGPYHAVRLDFTSDRCRPIDLAVAIADGQ
jgi:hypothetical protein